MTLNEYQDKAMETCLPESENFSYMMLNLVGEVGEFAGKVSPKVNYKPSDDIAGAVRSASLAWATAKDEEEGEETPDDNEGNGGNNGDDELEG